MSRRQPPKGQRIQRRTRPIATLKPRPGSSGRRHGGHCHRDRRGCPRRCTPRSARFELTASLRELSSPRSGIHLRASDDPSAWGRQAHDRAPVWLGWISFSSLDALFSVEGEHDRREVGVDHRGGALHKMILRSRQGSSVRRRSSHQPRPAVFDDGASVTVIFPKWLPDLR